MRPVRQGRPRATTGVPGWLPGKLGWLEHCPSLRNLHLPLAPPHPLLRTTARFSVFNKVLRKLSFRSPLPTGFTPTSLTWTTDEDDSFQRTTVEQPTVMSCVRKEAQLRFREGRLCPARCWRARCSRASPEQWALENGSRVFQRKSTQFVPKKSPSANQVPG